MSILKAQYQALKQQHEFTVMQLTDLKQNYERIKKLNTTILQNMMKQPQDFLRQIKIVIDGDLYHQKIIQLEAQLDKIRNNINDQIQRRVKQIIKNFENTYNIEHDCQNCQNCKKIWTKCSSCMKNIDNYRNLQKIVQQKNIKIDKLRIQIDDKKIELDMLSNKKNIQKIQQLEQINKILKSNVNQLQDLLRQQQIKSHSINQQWQTAYNTLYQQYQNLLSQLQQYKNYYTQEQQQKQQYNQKSKKNIMVKQIQNILGQLGNNRKISNNGNSQMLKTQKYNPGSSRMMAQDSDFSNFSIKDAINRPNQFTFF